MVSRLIPIAATTAHTGFLPRAELDELIRLLGEDGRRVIGPTVDDGTIVYEEIQSAADLPIGQRDDQGPARYRLVDAGDERAFGYTVGPTSWKRYTFPSRVPIGRADRDAEGHLTFVPVEPDAPPLAFFGVRGCELAALRIQDRVLAEGPAIDPDYAARRANTLVVAVECTIAAATCFCRPSAMLRAMSTIMRCSARSFSFASRSRCSRRSALRSSTRGRVPAMGRVSTRPCSSCTSRSGEQLTTSCSGNRR